MVFSGPITREAYWPSAYLQNNFCLCLLLGLKLGCCLLLLFCDPSLWILIQLHGLQTSPPPGSVGCLFTFDTCTFFCFVEMVLLYSPGRPWTHEPPASASHLQRLFNFYEIQLICYFSLLILECHIILGLCVLKTCFLFSYVGYFKKCICGAGDSTQALTWKQVLYY